MARLILLSIFTCLVTTVLGQVDQPELIGDTLVDPNRHREYVDPSLNYQLEWYVDWARSQVIFNVSVATHGNVVLGLSLTKQPDVGADLVIAGVGQNGKSYFGDFHFATNQKPVLDRKQDWTLLAAWESSTRTFLQISRPFDTCDQDDVSINDDTRYIIWGYGDGDQLNAPVQIRGSFVTYMLDPDYTPQSIKDYNAGLPGSSPELGGDMLRWNIHEVFRIPPKPTTYWCKMKKFTFPNHRHGIGQNYRITPPEVKAHVRSALLFRCHPPAGISSHDMFEQFVNHPGQECYEISKPLGPIPVQYCTETVSGYGVGTRPTFVAGDVGGSAGATDRTEYFVLQIHYDNPAKQNNIVVTTDIDLYSTARLRPNEGASMALGQTSPASPSILVPKGEKSHRIHGHCSSACTQAMLPPQGIRIVQGFLHAQNNIGLTIKLQHFRNGRELRPIVKDENYQVEFQNIRNLRDEPLVLPGDHLVVSCYYDTSKANKTAVGGFSATQEMCTAQIQYYGLPRGQFPVCESVLVSPEYNFRYLAGATNLTWDQSRLEFMATAPPQLRGMTVSQISDTVVNWTPSLRAELQRDHIVLPQVTTCPEMEKTLADAQKGIPPPPPQFTSYPVEAVPFQEPRKCSQPTGSNRYTRNSRKFRG